MTRITDTLYNANGTTADATVSVKSPRFTAADGRSIAQNSMTIKATNGAFTVQLEPTPPGVHYDIQFQVPATGSNWSERWVIPESEKPLKFEDVQEKKKTGSA
jgi:hypothetical protein